MHCDYCNGTGLSETQDEYWCAFCGGTGALLSPQAEMDAETRAIKFVNKIKDARHRAERGGEPKKPF